MGLGWADRGEKGQEGEGVNCRWTEDGRSVKSTLPCHLLSPYLHHVDKVKKELLGILLPVGGELRVTLANEGLEHSRGNAILNFLGRARAATQLGLKRPPSGLFTHLPHLSFPIIPEPEKDRNPDSPFVLTPAPHHLTPVLVWNTLRREGRGPAWPCVNNIQENYLALVT